MSAERGVPSINSQTDFAASWWSSVWWSITTTTRGPHRSPRIDATRAAPAAELDQRIRTSGAEGGVRASSSVGPPELLGDSVDRRRHAGAGHRVEPDIEPDHAVVGRERADPSPRSLALELGDAAVGRVVAHPGPQLALELVGRAGRRTGDQCVGMLRTDGQLLCGACRGAGVLRREPAVGEGLRGTRDGGELLGQVDPARRVPLRRPRRATEPGGRFHRAMVAECHVGGHDPSLEGVERGS